MNLLQLLTQVSKDIHSETSQRLKCKLSTRLNTMQCLILHRACIGEDINGGEYESSRNILIRKKCIDFYLTGKKAKNYKFVRLYKPTTLGIVAHGEMLDAFNPIVKRINDKLKEAKGQKL